MEKKEEERRRWTDIDFSYESPRLFQDYDRHLFVVIRIRRDSKVSYGSGLVITFLS